VAKVRVPVFGTVGKSVFVNPDSVTRSEMTAAIEAAVDAAVAGIPTDDSKPKPTLWRLIREVPRLSYSVLGVPGVTGPLNPVSIASNGGLGQVLVTQQVTGNPRITWTDNPLWTNDHRWLDSQEIQLGTDGDLRLFHNGTNGSITNTTGTLVVTSSAGEIELRPNTAQNVLIPLDNSRLDIGASRDLRLYHDGTNSFIQNQTGSLFFNTSGTNRVALTQAGETLFSDGDVGAPSQSYISDPDSGLYRIGSNNVGFALGGSLVVDFSASRVLFNQDIQYAASAGQSTANVRGRGASNSIEWGHTNSAGFGSTLGFGSSNGRPFLAFNAEHGTNANTFLTRGIVGRILQSDAAGGLLIGRAATASADNQALTVDLTVNTSGQLLLSDGAAATPGVAFATDPDCGLYRVTTNEIAIATAATERLRFNASGALGLAGANYGTAGQYARSAGSAAVPTWATIAYSELSGTPTIPTGANPTASVGLTAVNGVATTFMRSDGAPALSQSISPTWSGTHTFSNPVLAADGALATPGWSFSADPNTGVRRSATDEINIVTGGADRFRINASGAFGIGGATYGSSGQVLTSAGSGAAPTWQTPSAASFPLLAPNGTVGAPSYSFTNDTDTGVYLDGVGQLSFAVAGGRNFTCTATVFQHDVVTRIVDGAAATPGLAFNNDPDTGMYRSSANRIEFAAAGALKFSIDSAFNRSDQVFYLQDGAAATPAVAFDNDRHTGLYSSGADSIAIATGGSNRMQIGTAIIQTHLPIRIEAAASNGAASTLVLGNGSAATATAGAATLPSNPVGFLSFILNGSNIRVPYYSS
jgi:hypothetical protein